MLGWQGADFIGDLGEAFVIFAGGPHRCNIEQSGMATSTGTRRGPEIHFLVLFEMWYLNSELVVLWFLALFSLWQTQPPTRFSCAPQRAYRLDRKRAGQSWSHMSAHGMDTSAACATTVLKASHPSKRSRFQATLRHASRGVILRAAVVA